MKVAEPDKDGCAGTSKASTAEQLSDDCLAQRARKGDAEAVEAIMRRYNQRFFRLARSVVSNDSDAEDALQDAYVRAFTHLGSFKGRSEFSTWLSRIVLNEALGRIRRRKREWEQASHMKRDGPGDDVVIPFGRTGTGDPEALLERSRVRTLIEDAITELPAEFRSVFVLRIVEQLSIEETAQVLDIPEATVKSRTFRARRLLKTQLQETIEDVLTDSFTFLGKRCDRTVTRVLERLALKER